MKSQSEKAEVFAALHDQPGCFVIPNPWDAGSARILAALGFKALTTTSAGYAWTLGRTDYQAGRDAVLAHIRDVAPSVDVPLNGDLENGFGHAPEDCAVTIRMSADAGLVGGSIEDATGDKDAPIYETGAAVERIRAAAEAARGMSFRYFLTARCENYLHGRRDLKDTIARLQAYQEAGADVLFAPGLQTADEIRTVCAEVDRPVNVLLGPWKEEATIAEIADMGAKRISVGGALAAAAYKGLIDAAQEIIDYGTMEWRKKLTPPGEVPKLIAAGTPK